MRPFGQPPHNVFCTNDRHGETFGIAVDGGTNVQTTWFQKIMTGCQIGQWVGHVFYHFHVQHDIKLFLRSGHGFGGGETVINLKP